ncbi:MAG: hypothetical protein ACP5XB_05150 [Isosphaeraceae bacterium]
MPAVAPAFRISCSCSPGAGFAGKQGVELNRLFNNRQSSIREGPNRPAKKHLKGASDKEQREYEHIKESAEKSGRYGDRAKEVAARTVMKHHKKEQHKKGK